MSKSAEKLYEEFHKYAPKEVKAFHASMKIPTRVALMGPAVHVMYRSAKCDPITYVKPSKPIDYIHEHEARVKVYDSSVSSCDVIRMVPKRIIKVPKLTMLGKCLGFAFLDENDSVVEATCTNCDLFSIPSGKALLIIEKKKKVLVMIWGGKLDVEPRGIVG
jgi:hypothetical protein